MRTFNFKARNIGQEKYLTYTMGEECELDEDVLDYCQENDLNELINIIYEEDDDYDYLTYDITDKTSLADYIADEMNVTKVLYILRNVANNMISLKEQAVHLAYILLNKNFMYVNEENLDIAFICLPIESQGSVAVEFKSFVRQLLANMKYDVEEDLSYVGKLLTYINGDNFNLRGLVGLAEALMEEAGIQFEEAGAIEADGVEVVNTDTAAVSEPEETKVTDFMNSLDDNEEALPEIGDDEDEVSDEEDTDTVDEELDSILPAGMKVTAPVQEEADEKADEATKTAVPENDKKDDIPTIKEAAAENTDIPTIATHATTKETDEAVIKDKIKKLMGDTGSLKTKPEETQNINSIEELDQLLDSKPPVVKKTVVKVNRAAIIQNVAAEKEEEDKTAMIEDAGADGGEKDDKPKSNSVLSKTVPEHKTANLVSMPKAVPYLIRVNTEERIMLGKVVFKLGKASRGVDYTVGGNGAISRQHAVILQKDGVCYIKDNKSTNHTYVNDKMVEEGVEEILTHDSTIRLGDEEFIFKIR